MSYRYVCTDQYWEFWAQVIVIDSDYGDANIVDFCLPAANHLSANYKDHWRRVLIDTGPPMNGITNSIKHVLENVNLPVIPSNDVQVRPDLAEFQVTHTDADHIGNASALLTLLDDSNYFVGLKQRGQTCNFVFPHVPDAVYPPPLQMGSLEPQFKRLNDENVNLLTFAIERNEDWEKHMRFFDFVAKYEIEISFQQYTRTSAKAQYDPNNSEVIYFWYDERYYKKNPSITVQITITISDCSTQDISSDIFSNITSDNMKLASKAWVRAPSRIPNDAKTIIWKEPRPADQRAWFIKYWSIRTTDFKIGGRSTYLAKLGDSFGALQNKGYLVEHRHMTHGDCGDIINGEAIPQLYVSPTNGNYYRLGRTLLKDDYNKLKNVNKEESSKHAEIMNRASVVTVFGRKDLGKIKMLFTGDAFDQSCDIRHTIAQWDNWGETILNFNVMKIPHHGSNVTSDVSFYHSVRAEVYLICGAHYKHGNPKYSAIEAIVKTIKERVHDGHLRDIGLPYRIFFSSPTAHEDYTSNTSSKKGTAKTYKSAIRQILESKYRPVETDNGWDYEIYRLKKAQNRNLMVSWGVINFGAIVPNENSIIFGEIYDPDHWVRCNTLIEISGSFP